MKGHNFGLCKKCNKVHRHPKGTLGKHWNLSEETKQKMRKPKSEEHKRKLREIVKQMGYLKSNYFSKGNKLGKKNKGRKRPDLSKRNKDPEFIKKRLKGLIRKQTKPEQILMKLIEKYNLPFIYCGNGSVIIESFNPDFMDNNGSKKIIEIFGDYWHNRPEVKERDRRRLKVFAKYGFRTIIIWENQIKNLSEREILKMIK